MIKIKLIGSGAAGNKGAIAVVEAGVLNREDILLVNSTIKDIPGEYRDEERCYVFDTIGGCGKEIPLARKLTLFAIEQGGLDERIDNLIDEDTDLVICDGSTSGGTGAGSLPVIAEYIKTAIGVPVCILPFTGFDNEARGLQNTIEFFQNLDSDYVIQSISNKKFLPPNGTNFIKAEKDANMELVERIRILSAMDIVDSEQNMDDRDLYKTATSPGYMLVNKASLKGVKTLDQFNKVIVDMVDNDKSLDVDMESSKVARLGIFLNIPESMLDIVDCNFTALKQKLGDPYETYPHIQYEDDQEPYISFIAQGLAMPKKAIKDLHKIYKELSERVDKKDDDFFDEIAALKGNSEDNMFNVNPRRRNVKSNKDAFMKKYTKQADTEEAKEDGLKKY